MSGQKLATFLLGVGFFQVANYANLKKYQERSHNEIQDLLKEHRQVVDEAKERLNKTRQARTNQ